jgi:protein tyrosine phosphatase (PTP) superfamily phosphohydrolase (DUF442 family)
VSDALDAIQGVTNACRPAPGLLTGGQPQAHHLEALATAGGAVVLDIRDPMEPRSIEEPATARGAGLEYVNVPVTPGTLDDETLERILEVVRGAGEKQVFIHCGSGNRVGGALIPYFMLDLGMDEEAAVEKAMQVGLRSPEMMQWGLDYAHRKAGTTT